MGPFAWAAAEAEAASTVRQRGAGWLMPYKKRGDKRTQVDLADLPEAMRGIRTPTWSSRRSDRPIQGCTALHDASGRPAGQGSLATTARTSSTPTCWSKNCLKVASPCPWKRSMAWECSVHPMLNATCCRRHW